MLFDTHSHLNFEVFKEKRKEIIKKCLSQNIWMINVGTNFFSSKKAVEIAKEWEEGVFAAVGLHPINIDLDKKNRNESEENEDIKEKEFEEEKYQNLINFGSKKVVAIGEIGFDFWNLPKEKEEREKIIKKQEEIFLKQLKLAQKNSLPVIFHCRKAFFYLIKILESHNFKVRGVIHCFTGDFKVAKKFLEKGFFLGFNGIIFKMNLKEVIKKVPLEKILLETDAPFLSPPFLKEKVNTPLNLDYIAKEIAEIKKVSKREVEEKTTENAKKLFLG